MKNDGISKLAIYKSLNLKVNNNKEKSMSVLEIDKKEVKKLAFRSNQKGWQQQFRKNLYHHNYAKYYKK